MIVTGIVAVLVQVITSSMVETRLVVLQYYYVIPGREGGKIII